MPLPWSEIRDKAIAHSREWADAESERAEAQTVEFHRKLRSLVFLDPACGCGNFLVIAYREPRLLELEVLRAVHGGPGRELLKASIRF